MEADNVNILPKKWKFQSSSKASTTIVKVFVLPFEVFYINQIIGTSVKYYKRNNSMAE